jgi:hypothetical protein
MLVRIALLSLLVALMVVLVRAADVTGTWRVTISVPDGPVTGLASFSQAGDSVTGWVGPSESDPIRIKGVLRGNKLTIETFPQPGRTVAFHKCYLTVSRDNLAGTIDTDNGTIEFVRTPPGSSRR